jgi:hypothetical protein
MFVNTSRRTAKRAAKSPKICGDDPPIACFLVPCRNYLLFQYVLLSSSIRPRQLFKQQGCKKKKTTSSWRVPDQITANCGVTKFGPGLLHPIMTLMRIFEGYFSATIPCLKLCLMVDDVASRDCGSAQTEFTKKSGHRICHLQQINTNN